MARIAGVDIPNNKRVEIALTYIYGIGLKSSKDILAATGIDPDKRAKDLTEEDTAKLREEIEKNYHVEGDLRRDVALDIKRHDRNQLLPWYQTQKGSARKRTENQDQRENQKGSR